MNKIKSERVGLDSNKLKSMDLFFKDKYLNTGKLAGIQTLISRKGKIVHFNSIGKSDVEKSKNIKSDTIFRIYSMTKPITSVALMQLHEQGLFQLADPVGKFLPEFKNSKVFLQGSFPNFLTTPAKRDMTVRDLLSHTSGLTYGFHYQTNIDHAYRKVWAGSKEEESDFNMPPMDLKTFSETIAKIPLEFSPGDRWNYSVSTDICGRLIEVLSGLSLQEYFKKYIFKPLEMIDTDFYVPANKLSRFAACYERTPKTYLKLNDSSDKSSSYSKMPLFQSGGGGLVSTSSDYHNFCFMLLNGGKFKNNRILSRKTIELMTLNHLPENKDMISFGSEGSFSEVRYKGVGFGLGFGVNIDVPETQNSGSIGSFNWGGAASTFFWIDPKEDLICIMMTQLMPSGYYPIRVQMQSMVYGSFID
jgi:CubicO group peptidase (beta-lactamase class C family)|tara:strand:- start:4059 stop:5309 length:1251 start_codon:yes stop_codon:yes gene_type:complete